MENPLTYKPFQAIMGYLIGLILATGTFEFLFHDPFTSTDFLIYTAFYILGYSLGRWK